jgi:hypothetical protein
MIIAGSLPLPVPVPVPLPGGFDPEFADWPESPDAVWLLGLPPLPSGFVRPLLFSADDAPSEVLLPAPPVWPGLLWVSFVLLSVSSLVIVPVVAPGDDGEFSAFCPAGTFVVCPVALDLKLMSPKRLAAIVEPSLLTSTFTVAPRMPMVADGVLMVALPSWLIWPPTKRINPLPTDTAILPVLVLGSKIYSSMTTSLLGPIFIVVRSRNKSCSEPSALVWIRSL